MMLEFLTVYAFLLVGLLFAAGSLIARRQDMATNQLLSHSLEQLLARSKRLRDTEAATMNMRLRAPRSGRAAGSSVVRGAADDLRPWRQP